MIPVPDAHKNFAASNVLTAPVSATAGTSLVVLSGEGARFPAPPFNATVWPASVGATVANAEIVRVTAISTDTLTITRAQEGTTARTIVAGDQIAATITAKTFADAEAGAFRNAWVSGSTYVLNDLVLHRGTIYTPKVTSPTTAPTVTADWQPLFVASLTPQPDPFIVATATANTDAFNPAPPAAVQDGDLLVVAWSSTVGSSDPGPTATGYTKVDGGTTNFGSTAYTHCGHMYYRRQVGTTTHTITFSGATNSSSYAAVWIRNAGAFGTGTPARLSSLNVAAKTLALNSMRLLVSTYTMSGGSVLTTPAIYATHAVSPSESGYGLAAATILSSSSGAAVTVNPSGGNSTSRLFEAEITAA